MTPSLRAKLDLLNEYLRDLDESQPSNFEAFEQDKMLRRYSERMLQMVIESCIHIGIEVLTEAGFRSPENYHDLFIVLGDHDVLPQPLVNSMTMLVELRNLLVYEHDVVDHMMIYSVLKKRLDDIGEFARAVSAYANGERYQPPPEFQPEPDDTASSEASA